MMMLLKEAWMCASPTASTLIFLFFLVFVLAITSIIWVMFYPEGLLGGFLLAGYGFAFSFARAAVVLGSLTAQGKTRTVAHTAVAPDVHQPLDVGLDLRTQRSFHLERFVQHAADVGQLFVIPILHLGVFAHAGFSQNLRRT